MSTTTSLNSHKIPTFPLPKLANSLLENIARMPSVTPSYTSSNKSSKSRKSSKSDRIKHPSNSPSEVEQLSIAPSYKSVDTKRESPRSPKSSSAPQPPELPADTLKLVVGGKIRRSRCGPEFLEEVAKGGSADVFEELGRKFKIITGPEAVGFYKKFLKKANTENDDETKEAKDLPKYVVFAVTVYDAGRKLVDYYMTWRGHTRARELKGSERRRDWLDSDFRKVARSIDKEFKRASIYGSSVASVAGSAELVAAPNNEPTVTETETKSKPKLPNLITPAPGHIVSSVQFPDLIFNADAKIDPIPGLGRTPLSATDSVMSLPFLNMIRGVPLGNRVPLRVTNPDRLSMISSLAGSVQNLLVENRPTPTKPLATVMEDSVAPSPSPITKTPETHNNRPSSVRRTRSDNSGDSAKFSTASTASSDSIHSTIKDKKPPTNQNSSEFLIVLLDEKIDKNSRTWHGLERQTSRSSARSTPTRISPWDGPLARPNGITYRSPPQRVSFTKGEESSSEEEWENSPVIPLKPYMTAGGSDSLSIHQVPMAPTSIPYMYPNATPMVSVGNLAHASPYPNNPYAQLGSPYIPAYLPSQYTPNTPISRPLSRSTYSGYPSPYIQTTQTYLPPH